MATLEQIDTGLLLQAITADLAQQPQASSTLLLGIERRVQASGELSEPVGVVEMGTNEPVMHIAEEVQKLLRQIEGLEELIVESSLLREVTDSVGTPFYDGLCRALLERILKRYDELSLSLSSFSFQSSTGGAEVISLQSPESHGNARDELILRGLYSISDFEPGESVQQFLKTRETLRQLLKSNGE